MSALTSRSWGRLGKSHIQERAEGRRRRRAFMTAHFYRTRRISQVLRLLEVVGWKELLIQLATLPILETADDLKSQATLRTHTFNYNLDLGQNSQSYDALAHIHEHSSGLCPPCLLWFGCHIPPSITFCKRWKRIKVGYTKSCGRSSMANSTTTFRTWETPRRICSCAGEASAALCFMVFPFIPVCSHFVYNKI
ncbi:uncharacterized protein [Dendrobates tinctorius]|uniref:uncharacterized protein isoform X2 n=1 Tax=Dendrobates tinctorius TaxID=92724 RepID=UPI003CC9D674